MRKNMGRGCCRRSADMEKGAYECLLKSPSSAKEKKLNKARMLLLSCCCLKREGGTSYKSLMKRRGQ